MCFLEAQKDVQMWEQFVCNAGQNASGDFQRGVDLFPEEKRGFEKSSNLTAVKSFHALSARVLFSLLSLNASRRECCLL